MLKGSSNQKVSNPECEFVLCVQWYWIDNVYACIHPIFPFTILYSWKTKNECIVTFLSFLKSNKVFFLSGIFFFAWFSNKHFSFSIFVIHDIFYSSATKSCMVSIWWCMKNRVVYRLSSKQFLFSLFCGAVSILSCYSIFGVGRLLFSPTIKTISIGFNISFCSVLVI